MFILEIPFFENPSLTSLMRGSFVLCLESLKKLTERRNHTMTYKYTSLHDYLLKRKILHLINVLKNVIVLPLLIKIKSFKGGHHMHAKEYLQTVYYLEKDIQAKQLNLDTIKQLSTNIQSPKITDTPTTPNSKTPSSHIEIYVRKIMELEDQIKEQKCILNDVCADILDTIDQIDDYNYQNILIMRYLNHNSWQEIADSLGYCKRQIYRMHNHALDIMDVLLEEDSSCHYESLEYDDKTTIMYNEDS